MTDPLTATELAPGAAGIDVDRARAETPGCEHVVHLNNAGASLPTTGVLETVVDHLRREAEIGGYEAATQAQARRDAVYDSAAALLGAAPDEIALVESATVAWNRAFASIPLRAGDRVLVSRAEYVANVLTLLARRDRDGIEIDLVPDDGDGRSDPEALAALLDDRVRLVALTHVPTNSGLVNPVAEVGRVLADHDALYLVDACQSAGQLALDMDEIGADLLSATGRKFLRAPRGTGFLYVRRSALDRLMPVELDLRSAEWTEPEGYELRDGARRFETWESNVAAVLGLGAALDEARAWGLDAIEARVRALASAARDRLRHIPGVALHDPGPDPCGIVTFTSATTAPERLADRLRADGVNVWVSDIGAARIDFTDRGLDAVIRASVHYYNTEAELDRLAELVAEAA